MDKIICLVGESASGKTTIAELLEKEGYNYIQSYTTRPKRFEGEKGHIFVNAKNYVDVTIEDTFVPGYMIAHTVFDNHHYWATKEQYQGKGNSIYIIDVAGVKELKEKAKDAEIIAIYIKTDHITRWDRLFKRSLGEKVFKNGWSDEQDKQARELTRRRIRHDKEAFRVVNCDYVVDAERTIEEVLEDVKRIIEGVI